MTEQEWLESSNPEALLGHLRSAGLTRSKPGRRKLRLYACGCCRQVEEWFPDERSRDAVAVAEQFADGSADDAALLKALEGAVRVRAREYGQAAMVPGGLAIAAGFEAAAAAAAAVTKDAREAVEQAMLCSQRAAQAARRKVTAHGQKGKQAQEAAAELQRRQANLIRDLFGNPFRPATLDSAWLTSTVSQLADAIHQVRAFDRLPILGDALEEAGCSDPEILNHCRQPGEHFRGCWVIDLLTGRK